MSESFVSWRTFFLNKSVLFTMWIGMHRYFLTTYRYTRGKIHRKLSILQKRDLYLNQFSNKKGPFVNLRGRKCAPSGPHIPIPTFPLWYPPKLMMYSCNHENDVTYIIGSCIISLSNYRVIQKTIHVTIHKSSPWRLVQRSRITKADRHNS